MQMLSSSKNWTSFADDQMLGFTQAYHHYFMANYQFSAGETFEIEPSFLYMTGPFPNQFQVGGRAIYKGDYWLSAAYRSDDAVVISLGLATMKGLTVAYAYDMTTSVLKNHLSGSHEISLAYRIKNK